jgi:ribosomal protein S18 acetylase RimI-like enzyme
MILPATLENQAVRVIPLVEADRAAIDFLFDQQCVEWSSRLRWDYTGPSRVLREVVARKDLLGFAAVAGSTIIGFSFHVIESARCSIGDIFVSEPWRHTGADAKMAAAILDSLSRLPRLRRIECQSPTFGNQAADVIFGARAFQRFERHFMIADLSSFDARAAGDDPPGLPKGDIVIRKWNEDDFGPASRVIYKSYKAQDDGKINILYGSEEGCGELLSILIDSIWCGRFMPDASYVATHRKGGNQVGVLIASRIAHDVGHIGQVSVLPGYQGLGIGRRMIHLAMAELVNKGFTGASLAVTHANTRALRLYEASGFKVVHTFPVYYWQAG